MESTAKQIARWVALGALFLLPLTPLIVADTYFFPFITGKAFYLRILIEVAVVAWIVLAFLDKEYRPRFSWIGAAVVGFVAWMFIADAFAINSSKAFWSNFERMEGWVLLVHLLGLFFSASAVLRVEKKWRAWFFTSLGVSVVIVGYALLQLNGTLAIHQGSTRIDASLGNSAYLAIYLLFSTFVALWLALTESRAWLKWSLIALAVVQAVLIFFTETRGTIIGLVLALSLAAFLTAMTAGHKARRLSAAALALILIFVGGFYLARNSEFVQQNHTLQRTASISLADGQTRFTIWGMAFKGVLERPLTGYGQEGFNYVFNKFYEPSLYAQEQWFDRAHNAFIDWLSAGGIPAFLLYLSLFGSAIVLLWRSSELSRPERIALTAALVGYAVHNLFVFDNLYSYIYFFAILALIDSQVSRPIEKFERAPALSAADGTTYALPIATIAVFASIWFVNISGMQAATKLITAISPMAINVFEIGAMNFWPDDPEAHLTLAAAYYATGRPSDAIAQLQAVGKMASSDPSGSALKAESDTLIQEITSIETGVGVPEHVEYLEKAIQSMKGKASVLRISAVQQLRNIKQAQKNASPDKVADLQTQASNLRSEISVLDALASSASDKLAQEVKNERIKGLLRNLEDFKNLLARQPFAAQEVREQLVSFASAVAQSQSATNEQKQRAVSLAIGEMQKHVAAYPRDARGHLQLSYAYRVAGDGASARKELETAIQLSPKKIGFYIEKGTMEWDSGDVNGVQKDFNTAYALAPQFSELALYAAVGNIVANDQAAADRILMSAFGTTTVDNPILSVAYYRAKNWPRLINFWKMRAEKPGAGAEVWFSLAAAYYTSGDKANAVKTINTAVALYPDSAAAAAAAIKQIQEGK